MKKLSDYLKNDKIQRLIYGIGLALWGILWFSDLKYMSKNNSYGFYVWSVLIPIPILIGQIIFNSKIIWNILLIYISLYSLQIIWNLIMLDIIIDINRDFSPQPFWRIEKLIKWLILFITLFATNWIIWKIKPIKIK